MYILLQVLFSWLSKATASIPYLIIEDLTEEAGVSYDHKTAFMSMLCKQPPKMAVHYGVQNI